MNKTHLIIATLLLSMACAPGQVPDLVPNGEQSSERRESRSTSSNNNGERQGQRSPMESILASEMPFYHPGSEVVSWDGRHWHVTDNRVFRARFERYLSAAEEADEQDLAYRQILQKITQLLAPGSVTSDSLDEAFRLLPEASNFSTDSNLCDALADAVYSVWLAQRERNRLARANESLQQQRRAHEWNASMAGSSLDEGSRPRSAAAAEVWAKERQERREAREAPYRERLDEVRALIVTNQLKKEVSEAQAKLEFQALLVQLFTQRRFQHVLIGTRFYRSLFGDGDTALRIGEDAQSFFANTTGMPPTVGVLDTLAQDAIREAREGVEAFYFLLEKNELESAANRLFEAFVIGEYLPVMRTIPREDKRQTLEFTRRANQLLAAIEVKDYALAERLVDELEEIAVDFDNSRPLAAIETAKTLSAMHLAKAKNAAVAGDAETLEEELRAATEIWPRNPALEEVSQMIFSQADVQEQALVDLQRLLSQGAYRQIYEDQVRYIAATAMYPDHQDKLRSVLETMQMVEAAIIRSSEIAKRGDYAGAWESIEKVYQEFSGDNNLNQQRAELTTRAADFVGALRRAEELEERGQVGSSLAWYLKAQQLYAASDFAQEGINRLVPKIMESERDELAAVDSGS